MKILVTGGAGYIGTKLIKQLAKSDKIESIVVYDNLSRGNFNLFIGEEIVDGSKLKFVQGDILDSRLLRKSLEGIDYVYHLAAKVTTPFANTDPHFFEQINHWGTAELVYAIEDSNVKKLIHLSSTSVYGSSDNVVDETSPLNPRTFYGVAKKRAEGHVNRLMKKGRAITIRSGNVYGYSKSMRFDAVINRYAFETNFHGRITIQGSGKQNRSFIHVNDLVLNLALLINNEVPHDIYNMVSKNMSILDLADNFKSLRPDLEFLFVDQHLDLRNIIVNTDLKLANYLDMVKPRSIEEELKEFLGNFSY
ncbi:MAG: SDR family oxidoreductase [Bacteroidota bacterium]